MNEKSHCESADIIPDTVITTESHLHVSCLQEKLQLLHDSSKYKLLFITHNKGGGVEKHVRELIKLFEKDADILILKSEAVGYVSLTLPLSDIEKFYFKLPEDYVELKKFCVLLGIEKIHIQHLIEMPLIVWQLANDLSLPYDVTVHDYYYIYGSPTLSDKDGRYYEDRATREKICRENFSIPNFTLEKWRLKSQDLLVNAARVIAPSRSVTETFSQYYSLSDNWIVASHPDMEVNTTISKAIEPEIHDNEALRIMILGALSREKGADVLDACARETKRHGLPIKFYLVGHPYRELHKNIVQFGSYQDEALSEIFNSIQPHLIWFPAQSPETYSYTLSAALKTHYPIVTTNLGAFPERLQGRHLAWVHDWRWSARQWCDFFVKFRRKLIQKTFDEPPYAPVSVIQAITNNSFSYTKNYLSDRKFIEKKALLLSEMFYIEKHLFIRREEFYAASRPTFKAKMRRVFIKSRRIRLIWLISNLIPFGLQQKINGWLIR